MKAPFLALSYLLRPKLLALGFFPGAFTFGLAALIVYSIWNLLLSRATWWVAIPVMMLAFLATWLLFGNLSLLIVEDKIIDECQKTYWGEIRLSSRPFQSSKLFREIRFSLFLAFMIVLLSLLSFIPGFALIAFVLLAWINAYSFLSCLYSRKTDSILQRLQLFFHDAIPNLFLGIMLSLLLFVPVLNVFLLGYAQILASLVFFKREDAKSL